MTQSSQFHCYVIPYTSWLVVQGIRLGKAGELAAWGSLGKLGQLLMVHITALTGCYYWERDWLGLHTSTVSGPLGAVGVSATISLVGMEGIKLQQSASAGD